MKPSTILAIVLTPIVLCGGGGILATIVGALNHQPIAKPEQVATPNKETAAEAEARRAKMLADARAQADADVRRDELIDRATRGASLANYNRVASGMSYDEVLAIVGEPDQELSRLTIGDTETVVYQWSQPGTLGANMNATFQNGLVVGKAQYGLK